MRLAKLIGMALVVAQGACFSVATNGTGAITGQHLGCELTMQSNTLAGACGELVLRNTGSSTMHGWQITFDLPADGHLENTWDASFSADANVITITPLANETDLTPGQTVTLGYCASGASSNVVLTAGLCNGTAGTIANIPSDSGTNTDSEANPSDAVTVNAVAVSGSDVTGNYDPTLVLNGNTLQVVVDANGVRNSAIQGDKSYSQGLFSATLQAAPGAGIVTRFATETVTTDGLQGVVVALDGNSTHIVWIGVVHNNVAALTPVTLNFDVTAALHTYQFNWTASSIAFYVDGVTLGTVSDNVPPAVSSSLVVRAYAGTPQGAAGSAAVGTEQAQVGALIYAP